MPKIAFFSIADQRNLPLFSVMEKTLRKFYPSEEEFPLFLCTGEDLAMRLKIDPMFFYRSTPIIASELLEKYDVVIKIDADSLILGDLTHTWEGDFDVAVVNNSNPREFKAFPYQFLNIYPLSYVNNGFVVIKNKEFVKQWKQLCFSSLFNGAQMREQDMLNLLVHGNLYNIKRLDEGDYYHGLASKMYTPHTKLVDNKIILPKNAGGDGWPDKDKQLVVYHWAGGTENTQKGNYRTIFPDEVVKYIDTLVASSFVKDPITKEKINV